MQLNHCRSIEITSSFLLVMTANSESYFHEKQTNHTNGVTVINLRHCEKFFYKILWQSLSISRKIRIHCILFSNQGI